MTQSKQTIYEALNSVMLDVSAVAKRDRNQAQGFKDRKSTRLNSSHT